MVDFFGCIEVMVLIVELFMNIEVFMVYLYGFKIDIFLLFCVNEVSCCCVRGCVYFVLLFKDGKGIVNE